MPMKPKNDWFVYLRNDFSYASDALSDGAYRLHVSGLGWAATCRGEMLIPNRRIVRLTPYYQPSDLAELTDLEWWIAEGDGHRIADRPYWMVCRDRETRKAIPKKVRLAVYLRDGHRCVECSAREDLTLDHIIPYSKGGSDDESNLRTLCRSCNSRKGARV